MNLNLHMTLNLVPKLSKASDQNICLAATGFRIIPAAYNHHQKELWLKGRPKRQLLEFNSFCSNSKAYDELSSVQLCKYNEGTGS